MDLLQHTITWCKGEIFEGKISLLFGIVIILVAMTYWIFGSTPLAKSMIIPLLIVGVFATFAGIYLVNTNQKRIPQYEKLYVENAQQFIENEKERTEAFIVWYPKTRIIMGILTVVAILLMSIPQSGTLRGIGLGLMLFTFYIFFLDHFSEERALEYYKHITELLN